MLSHSYPFPCLFGMPFGFFSNLSFTSLISLQLYLIWYLTLPKSYTFKNGSVSAACLLCLFPHGFWLWVHIHLEAYLWEFFEICVDSSSREDLCLLWPSTIGTIYPGPLYIEMFNLWAFRPCKQCGHTSTREMFYLSTQNQGRERQLFCCLPLQGRFSLVYPSSEDVFLLRS